ncbi:MAG: type II toxin-antitoxin system RelE/ParE family toxin [Cyanobacteria bacterium M_DeepCast_100m_m1_067]|nr:type II toxin-antitoxin system RelE/ParE family toxin [Cyanobacteria bacterium M_DeepCast_100m_m1_067]
MTQAPWSVVFAADAVEDLALIEAHLMGAYQAFGEQPVEAAQHAQARLEAIITAAERLALAPLRGEAHDDLLPGLRHLTLDSAVYWFRPLPPVREIQVLAVVFGGQDHQRHMLVRLL